MANTIFSKKDKARVAYFLELFSKERTDIRANIASVLPAYNELLEMHALTFEQFALQIEAQKRGIDYCCAFDILVTSAKRGSKKTADNLIYTNKKSALHLLSQ